MNRRVPTRFFFILFSFFFSLAAAQPPLQTAYFAAGCFWSTETGFEKLAGVTEVVSGYMGGTLENPTYEDVLTTARDMDRAIDALIAQPSDATLNAARERWKAARVAYSHSESFRFYAGPIDGDGGPESQVNGWPMDENHIDAVAVSYNAAPGANIVGVADSRRSSARVRY